MLEIFRIEKDGIGPYNHPHISSRTEEIEVGGFKFKEDIPMWAENSHHPDISNHKEGSVLLFRSQVLGFKNAQVKFGFNSEEQIKGWFTEKEIDNLKKLGFKIESYKLHDDGIIAEDEMQVLFDISKICE